MKIGKKDFRCSEMGSARFSCCHGVDHDSNWARGRGAVAVTNHFMTESGTAPPGWMNELALMGRRLFVD